MSILVCVPGEAIGKGRPRVAVRGGRPSMYTPPATAEYESKVKAEAMLSMRGKKPLDCAVAMRLQIFMGVPQSYSKKLRESCLRGFTVPQKKPDMDNVVKLVCDAFNGAVWIDDTQLADLHATRRYSETPCIIAEVSELDLSPVDLLAASD